MKPSERIHGFDALRAFALLLGIVIHAVMPYLNPPLQIWPVVEAERSILYTVLVVSIHAFRLQTFFLLAGFFTALLINKRGWQSFAVNRLKRIVVPFICCIILLVPLLQMMMIAGYADRAEAGYVKVDSLVVDTTAYHTTIATFFSSGAFLHQTNFFHFWFLYYLIIIYVAFLALHLPLKRWRISDKLSKVVSPILNSNYAAIPLACVSMLTLFPMHFWQVDTPYSVVPDLWVIIYYFVYFLFGVWMFNATGKIKQLRKATAWNLGAAIVLLPIALYLQSLGPNTQHRPYQHAVELPAEFVYSLFSWCMVFGLLGGFAQWFAKPNRQVRAISDAAYWQYIVHLPLIFGLQLILSRVQLPSVVEVLVQVVYAFVVLQLSYLFFVRDKFLGRLLNGPQKAHISITE